MTRTIAVLCGLLPFPGWTADIAVPAPVRGRALSLVRLEAAPPARDAAVLFLPGDGGWRGTAIAIARTISGWGYEVYGFDTRRYLESFSEGGAALSTPELAADIRDLAARIAGDSRRKVILVGWSQGAGMAIAAASGTHSKEAIQGIVTLGLPESAVLGWDWKATVAVLARREPDQPAFRLKPLLAGVAPVPVWMIHGSADEYTAAETARGLFASASEPKRMTEIPGANHRFDGRRDELFRSLKGGLEWISSLR